MPTNYYDLPDSSPTIVVLSGGWVFSVRSLAYTALSNDEVAVDTTAAPVIITLPIAPSTGARVRLLDYAGTWATNNVTVSRNGELINGVAANFTLNVNLAYAEFVYTGATVGWRVIA